MYLVTVIVSVYTHTHKLGHILTSIGCYIYEGTITLILEEEVGPILIVTKYVRGCFTQDGPHSHAPTP